MYRMSGLLTWSAILVVLLAGGCMYEPSALESFAGPETPMVEDRPLAWAQPVVVRGVVNAALVDDGLLRGGHPTAEGFEELRAMGVRKVVNLRWLHPSGSMAGRAGLREERILVQAWAVEQAELRRFLELVTEDQSDEDGGIFVHCYTGADRVGLAMAAYRVVVQGWSKSEAISEMEGGGFGFHEMFREHYRQLIGELDVEAIRRELGLDRADAVAGGRVAQQGVRASAAAGRAGAAKTGRP
jgi:protein tyrosine phosphatase (PTP) superfamily phosphohydrolase (DUF442 family)